MSKARSRARQRAVQALYQWQLTGQDVADIDAQFLAEQEMGGADVGYFRELLRQIPLHLEALDDQITTHLDRPIGQVDPVERAILRIGAYELQFHPEIPYRVVINEGVNLAKIFGAEEGYKYINSILDKVAAGARAAEYRTR